MNKRKVGAWWEQQAENYLINQGVKIVARNFRNRRGEIDLIGYDGKYLVFFEVKYRSTTAMGSPLEAVDFHKQKQICMVADYYRYSNHLGQNIWMRYDVIGVQGNEVTWIKNAFPHIYIRG